MQTKTRRLLQPIWNIFDFYLTPKNTSGLVLCVSGGSDSRALMESIAYWPRRFQKIHVVSVDHKTRPETLQEAQAVCSRARVLGFESQVLTLARSTKKDEATLRTQRYAAIWSYAREHAIQSLVTAHTEDDQAESFVMDLMGYGGGPEGAGMRIETPLLLGEDVRTILRPLLPFSRAHLIAILTALKIYDYFTDPTNEHSEGKRVKVRYFLSLHQAPKSRLAALAEKRRLDLEALQIMASQLITQESDCMHVRFNLETPEALRFQALKMALSKLLPDQDLRSAHKVLSQIAKFPSGCATKTYHLPGCVAKTTPNSISLERKI